MDDPQMLPADCTKSSDNSIEELEKIARLFFTLLQQATATGCSVLRLRAVRRVVDYLSSSKLLLSPPKTVKQERGTQTMLVERRANISENLNLAYISTRARKVNTKVSHFTKGKPIIESSMQDQKFRSTHRLKVKTHGAAKNTQAEKEKVQKAAMKAKKSHHPPQKTGVAANYCNDNFAKNFDGISSEQTHPCAAPGVGKVFSSTKKQAIPSRNKTSRRKQKSARSRSMKLKHAEVKSSKRMNLYKWKQSEKSFTCRQNLKAHKGSQLRCSNKCDQDFPTKRQLQLHVKRAHAEQKHVRCVVCSCTCPGTSALERHYLEHHGLPEGADKHIQLTCELCGGSSQGAHELAKHMALHLDATSRPVVQEAMRRQQKSFSCQVCGKSLSTRQALVAHRKRHRSKSEGQFHCDFCSETFDDVLALKNHRLAHSNEERPYKCVECGKGFKTQTTLRTHKMLHTGELPYTCDVCGKRFIQTSALNTHKLRHTADEENLNKSGRDETQQDHHPLHCDICGRVYKTELRLQLHIKTHDQESDVRCQFCPKMFTSAREAEIHRRTHSKGKLYCRVCGEGFESRSEHYFHTKSHTLAERPHLCSKCGKSFSTPADLETHQRRHELRPEQKKKRDPFICTICGKMYVGRSSLTVHMKAHAGVFDLPCDLCPKKFKTPAELRHHRRIHTNEKPYVCDVCNRAFSRHSTLANHKRSHNAERPYLCGVCGAAFKLMNTLKKHSKIHKKHHMPSENSGPSLAQLNQQTESVPMQNAPPNATTQALQQQGRQNQKLPLPHTADISIAATTQSSDELLVPPPPPYPTHAVGAVPFCEARPSSQPAQASACEPLIQISLEPNSLLELAHPQLSSQLSEQTLKLLGLSSTVPMRAPQPPQIKTSKDQLGTKAACILTLRGQIPQLPSQSFLTTPVRQPQLLAASVPPTQQIRTLFQTDSHTSNNKMPLVKSQADLRTVGPQRENFSLPQSGQTPHQLLGLQGQLRLTAPQQHLVTAIPHGALGPSQPATSSIDQPLFRLQTEMAHQAKAQPLMGPAGGLLQQEAQTLITPTNLVLGSVNLLTHEISPSDHTQMSDSETGLSDNQLHVLQTQPSSSSSGVSFPPARSGKTLVLLSAAHQAPQPAEMLSLSGNTSDPMPASAQFSQSLGVDEEDDEAEEEEAEAVDNEEDRGSTPNLLDLTNTTTYTYYYY